jgi:hypothetical protein
MTYWDLTLCKCEEMKKIPLSTISSEAKWLRISVHSTLSLLINLGY